MESFIIKAIQAFSKTSRAQRLKAAIKAYRDHECLTTEPEQAPKAEETESIPLFWQREIAKAQLEPTPEETEVLWQREIANASTSQLEIALRSDPQIRTAQPTPEETEAFFDNLDFAMLDQGGSRLGNTFAKFNQ